MNKSSPSNSPEKSTARRNLFLGRSALVLAALLLFSGCEENEPTSDFERRYVLVAIPGFENGDYAALLDHRDPNYRYLAVANLTAWDALSEPPEEETEAEEEETGIAHAQLLGKVRSLLRDDAPKVRAIAAHAPSNQTEDEPGSESGLVALLDDPVDAVRVEALAALGNFEELKESSVDAIAGQRDDDNILVRFHALTALGTSCPDSKRDEITTALAESMPERDAAEQLLILQSLGSLGTPQAGQIVLGQLQSDDPRFVRAAVGMLSFLEIDGIESALLAALEKDTVPPALLLSSLTEFATGKSFAIAAGRLSDEDRELRNTGRGILLKIGTEEARVALLDAYHQLTPGVEEQLARPQEESESLPEEHLAIFEDIATLSKKLGRLAPGPESMKGLLSTGGTIEKRMALRQLREQTLFDLNILDPDNAGPEFMPLLLALAGDDSAILRAEACQTLGHSADSRAGEALAAALEDPVPIVRQSALESALKHVDHTANHDLMRELHARRDEFVPTTWEDDDSDLAIRLSLEEAVTNLEARWMSRDRFLKDLEPENSSVTRLIAGLILGKAKQAPEKTAPVLLDSLAGGTSGEKAFAIQIAGNSLTKAHLPRLREIAAAETDESQRQILEQLIDRIGE